MAQQAKPDLPVDDDRPAALRIPGRARQRDRDRVADDHIGSQRLRERPRNRHEHQRTPANNAPTQRKRQMPSAIPFRT